MPSVSRGWTNTVLRACFARGRKAWWKIPLAAITTPPSRADRVNGSYESKSRIAGRPHRCSFPRQRLCKASRASAERCSQSPRSLNNACDIRAAEPNTRGPLRTLSLIYRVYRKRFYDSTIRRMTTARAYRCENSIPSRGSSSGSIRFSMENHSLFLS